MAKKQTVRRINQIEDPDRVDIIKELKAIVNKHGKDEVRLVANDYFNRLKNEEKLKKEIERKQKELEQLKEQLP